MITAVASRASSTSTMNPLSQESFLGFGRLMDRDLFNAAPLTEFTTENTENTEQKKEFGQQEEEPFRLFRLIRAYTRWFRGNHFSWLPAHASLRMNHVNDRTL